MSSFQPIIVCHSELTEFPAELTEFPAELTEFAAELSEFSLPKQYHWGQRDLPNFDSR